MRSISQMGYTMLQKDVREVKTMKAEVLDGCIGCGLCEGTCPSVFKLGEDGLSHVIGEVTAANEEAAHDAEQGCPVNVIRVG